MSGTKNLSAYIVDRCQRNPRFAFLVIPLGLFVAYFGLKDAKLYQSLRGKPTLQMKVDRVYDAPNSRGFSVPHVAGQTPQGEVSFPISDKEARRIQVGQELKFVEASDSMQPYVTRDTLDEQLAGIRFSVAGLPVNDIVLVGSVISLIALGWGLFAKPKGMEGVVASADEGDWGADKSA